VNLLLDTHVALWWFDNPSILSEKAHSAIAEGENLVFISAAVAWEIAIKKALGKLDAPDNLEEVMAEENFQPLPITIAHALAVAALPPIHQDPFDRMQIAQAKAENLTLISRDALIRQYEISLIVA
jgi:PIN domain nuclease of toxin-antitoxin system